jgi:hypothetical protein
MNESKTTRPCKRIRNTIPTLWNSFRGRLAERFEDHIAHCPRCQRRLALNNRVEIGLCLLRSQPHNPDLLARANQSALNVLKLSLRNAPAAGHLRQVRPEPLWFDAHRPVIERILNVAACLFIAVIIRVGIVSDFNHVKQDGTKVLQKYYANNLDPGLCREIFGDSFDASA